MKCPKCKDEDQWENFCSNCGKQLKDKCPECGEMEWIGRKVCETKIKEAEEKLSTYQQQMVGEWRLFLFIFLLFAGIALATALVYTLFVYFDVFPETSPISWKIILPIIDLFLATFIFWLLKKFYTRQSKAFIKSKKEFFRLHPDYAELIKKGMRGN